MTIMEIKDIENRLGITLNDMQQASCDAILGGKDNVVILSPTGSGKTLAYLLPLTQLVDASSDNLQCVVIVPGRELAQQSLEVLESLKAGLRGYACYGGRPTMDEHRELRKVKPQIIFATPGRMNDHIDKGNVETDAVHYIVIDEFDKCLEMGFRNEMTKLLGSLPRQARRIFLSATDFDEDISGFKCLDFRPKTDGEQEKRVSIYTVKSPDKDKLQTLSDLLRSFNGSSTIVFLNYRESVVRTAEYLQEQGFTISAYHGGLDQKQREEAIYKFANGSANVLVSTDLGSRGLDMPIVENVVHYHLPESEDAYIHRVGRSTRWESKGNTYFILGPDEKLPDYIDSDVEQYSMPEQLPAPASPKMATLYIGKGKKNKISKGDIVGFLCKVGGLKSAEIGRIDVYEYYALVAIDRKKLNLVLKNVKGEKIKGQKTIIEEHN